MMRIRFINRFAKDQDGAAFVEFAILLPMLLLLFGVCIEGGRTFWSYQTTLTGVREAARYLARVVDADICAQGGTTTEWDEELATMVRSSLSGASLLPASVSVTGVVSTLACTSAGFRGGVASVATVTASLTIAYPFSGLFGDRGERMAALEATVFESARMLGR